MTLTHTEPPKAEWALGGALGIELLNDLGHPELNIPDAPQDLRLRLTNRSSTSLEFNGATRLKLRFRPGTLLNVALVRLAHESRQVWKGRASGAGAHHEGMLRTDSGPSTVTLRLVDGATLALAPGETTTVRLTGVAADPDGGTRPTRVRVGYRGLSCAGGAEGSVEGSQLVHLAVRRLRQRAEALLTSTGSGSAAVAGPFTVGFTTGGSLLNGGEAMDELHLRLANTSGRPVRLSADADAPTRLVLDYRIGNEAAPWGLLTRHGDHFAIEEVTQVRTGRPADGYDEPPPEFPPDDVWTKDGPTLRCVNDAVLSPGSPLDVRIVIHTSAPPQRAGLTVRLENLPEYDDLEVTLPVDVGPIAAYPDRTATIRPIELWGEEARVDFVMGNFDGDPDLAPRASLSAEGERALRLAAAWLSVVSDPIDPEGEVWTTGSPPTSPFRVDSLPTIRSGPGKWAVPSEDGEPKRNTDRKALVIEVPTPLLIRNGGGTEDPTLAGHDCLDITAEDGFALVVGGALRVITDSSVRTRSSLIVGGLGERDTKLLAGAAGGEAWLQSADGHLRLNPDDGYVIVDMDRFLLRTKEGALVRLAYWCDDAKVSHGAGGLVYQSIGSGKVSGVEVDPATLGERAT